MFSVVKSICLNGLDGQLINVQVDVYVYSEYEATSLLYVSDDITAYIQENI